MLLSPIQGKPVLTQGFGLNPKTYAQFGLKGHNGLDFRAPVGTPLFSPFEGVVSVTDSGGTGYGLHVKIRCNVKGKEKEAVLGHFSRMDVKTGDTVSMGQQLGLSGNSGFSTGPHLHFGFRFLLPGTGSIWTWPVKDAGNGFAGYVDQTKYLLTWDNFK